MVRVRVRVEVRLTAEGHTYSKRRRAEAVVTYCG
jgi:hypothetical protein